MVLYIHCTWVFWVNCLMTFLVSRHACWQTHMCTHIMQSLWDTTVLYTVPHWPPTCRDTAAVDHSSSVPSFVLPSISPAIDRYVTSSTRSCSLVVKNINYMSTYTGLTYRPPYKQFIHIQVVIHSETFTHNTWWALFALSSAAICVWSCCLSFANLPICLSSSFCSKCTNEFRACTGHTQPFRWMESDLCKLWAIN